MIHLSNSSVSYAFLSTPSLYINTDIDFFTLLQLFFVSKLLLKICISLFNFWHHCIVSAVKLSFPGLQLLFKFFTAAYTCSTSNSFFLSAGLNYRPAYIVIIWNPFLEISDKPELTGMKFCMEMSTQVARSPANVWLHPTFFETWTLGLIWCLDRYWPSKGYLGFNVWLLWNLRQQQ